MNQSHSLKCLGFTLIEILVVIGMLAILTTVVLVAVNPLRQFAQARNSERQGNVAAILNAITERVADNEGNFISSSTLLVDSCHAYLPSTAQDIKASELDLRPCLVPMYLSELPYDPSAGSNTCSSTECNGSGETYDLEYTVQQDASSSRITVCAPHATETALPNSTVFCLSR